MLTAMQFDTFVWPHNPRIYSIGFSRSTVIHKLPFGTYTVEDLGRGARIMEGEGEFYGKDAYATFRRLASLFYRQMPGVLLHPLWQSSSVYFDMLKLMEEPQENYLRYAFRFVEAPTFSAVSAQQTAPSSLTLSAGDTLWSVAKQHGLTVQELLHRNPNYATCNDARTGEVVRLA